MPSLERLNLMQTTLAGSSVVVTGAGSGIGAHTARRLAGLGAEVIAVDLDGHAARTVADQIGGVAMAMDVASLASWAELADRIAGGAPLRAVVLNAGVAGGAGVWDMDVEAYRRLWAVNVDGVVFGLRVLTPMLLKAGGGSVVVTASVAGLTGIDFDPVYAMTKHALIGLVRSVAPSLAHLGVRLQAVCPGLTETPLLGEAGGTLHEAGYPMLRASEVASTITDCVMDRLSAEVIVCQVGREPHAYRFSGIPGPVGAPQLPSGLQMGPRGANPQV
jgi:NAD(P)-dependent dehydrogenase (short-subunit alcohol dehydrogenase family)